MCYAWRRAYGAAARRYSGIVFYDGYRDYKRLANSVPAGVAVMLAVGGHPSWGGLSRENGNQQARDRVRVAVSALPEGGSVPLEDLTHPRLEVNTRPPAECSPFGDIHKLAWVPSSFE
jgi:hypothetical protein